MRRLGTLLVILLASSCGGGGKRAGTGTGGRSQLTPKDIAERSGPAIVRIEAGENTGTGFIVDKNGLVATNLHVVVGRKDVKIKLPGGDVYSVQQVAGVDPARDLALLKIAPPKPLPTVRLGDSSSLVAGDQVVAIGNPLGVFENSVSAGLISQVRPVCTREQVEHYKKNQARQNELLGKLENFGRCQAQRSLDCEAFKLTQAEQEELESLRCREELTVLQISAPISQGSSGGPLFNTFGEVVGVTTAIITGGQNINLAIPANYVKPLVANPAQISMEEFALKTKGFVERDAPPEDGIRIQRLVPDHALSIFQSCKPEHIGDMVFAVEQAIEVGAPLYNKGEIEACFRIYEGTAIKFERAQGCAGISAAFSDGLQRAQTLDTYKEKAWAMRDTFDGLLIAAKKWVAANGGKQPAPSGTGATPPSKK